MQFEQARPHLATRHAAERARGPVANPQMASYGCLMAALRQIPVWRDNYIYLVHEGDQAFVVDPTEAAPVLDVLKRHSLKLTTILNTHHHADHVGGNLELVEATGCRVAGPAHDADRIPGITDRVEVGTTHEAAGLSLRVLDVRAHTRGHICFALDHALEKVWRHGHGREAVAIERLAGRPALFVGDSLFLGGVGRLFEGTPEQLDAAMRVYREENPEALVCCAHEYTESNLRFALGLLPEHAGIAERLADLDDERAASGSSVPDTLGREWQTNVFLLYLEEGLGSDIAQRLNAESGALQAATPALVGAIRKAKDAA